MAKLLQRANIDVSILGPAENCTGDPARRSGNEYIFQMLAMQNIETLDSMGVKKSSLNARIVSTHSRTNTRNSAAITKLFITPNS